VLTRKLSRTTILKDAEVAVLGDHLASIVGYQFMAIAAKHRLDPKAFLRFGPVAERCRVRREELGLSVKQVAEQLKLAQRHLRDIENNQTSSLDPAIVLSYTSVLGLKRWYARWLTENPNFYARPTTGDA
jgi:hypothetical protein